jgi:hypothetical protein
MRGRWLVRLAAGTALGLALIGLLPVPRTILLGIVRNESFYKHRPTSYWRGIVSRYLDDVKHPPRWTTGWRLPPPSPSLFDRLARFPGGLFPEEDSPPDWEGDTAAIPVLAELLWDEDAEVRGYAAIVLSQAGPRASAALPRLTVLLGDDDIKVRGRSLVAVVYIESRDDVRLPLLVRMLKDPEPGIRILAARLIGEVGTSNDEVIAALKEALNDKDKEVREEAVVALKRIAP